MITETRSGKGKKRENSETAKAFENVPVNRMVHYDDVTKRLEAVNKVLREGHCPKCEQWSVSCFNRMGGTMFCKKCGHTWEI